MNEEAHRFLNDCNVSRICHFTKLVSLVHIFSSSDGIKATAFLEEDLKKINDFERFDSKTEFLNCSIEYPNTWYLEKIKDNDILFKEWVVLFINTQVILNREIMFSPCNAATDHGKYISNNICCLKEMYNEDLKIKRRLIRTKNMLECCPTDDQAEILIYRNIPIRYIDTIAVENEFNARKVVAEFKTLNLDYPKIIIAPNIFNRNWSHFVRDGLRAEEQVYTER